MQYLYSYFLLSMPFHYISRKTALNNQYSYYKNNHRKRSIQALSAQYNTRKQTANTKIGKKSYTTNKPTIIGKKYMNNILR